VDPADGKEPRKNFAKKVRGSSGIREKEKERKRNQKRATMKAAALIGALSISFHTRFLFSC
jgi:hypothetical protein